MTLATRDIVSYGYWVQQRRTALGLTRRELARQISCSPSTIKKIERDERRPSRQIAALLADQLLIPQQERERFIAMARGDFVEPTLSTPELISFPSFLWTADQSEKGQTAQLVARQRELAQLTSHLTKAVAGHGSILFITGEAGDGKTMLAQAFARQSQEQYPDLIVAAGHCNAYTGIGDPYLPFREILELLTGDIEARWDARTMSRTYAERLWQLVPRTVQALMDVGPDLLDTFLLSTPLLTRTAAAISPQSGKQLERLQTLIAHRQNSRSNAGFQQSNLFAQYTRLLQTLARQQPLLLIVDDLQWADMGSISLLFHLSHHLRGQRILLVGIYREAEVALGRNGERHPLQPLLNEIQHIFGEIQIRLNRGDGRSFVDALIDSEPNGLDRAFRHALHKQTAGHPLFTVEMLHGLQQRGDLVRNADGAWVASPTLDWNILPARVEGVIRERIGRLPRALQEQLQVASVVGETFCAETIAHIKDADVGRVISELGNILDREQRLLNSLGSQQVGTQQRSQYRFRHILFQQYLYNSLDQGQQMYLHRAIARELERCYGDETARIAPQLAHHYSRAGDRAQALHYFMLAGKSAAAIYANVEAEAHYRRALELTKAEVGPSSSLVRPEQLFRLYLQLGRILELSARYDKAIAVYEEMERTARRFNEPAMVLASLLARAAIRTTVNFARNPAEGRALLERARALALELGDEAAQAKILWNLLILSAYTGDDVHKRLTHGQEALTLARKLELPEQLAFTLHDIFYAYAGAGQWDRARAALYEAHDLWQRLGNLPMLAEAHMRLHWIYLVTGDYDQALTHADEAYRLGVESHNLDAQALSHFMVGFVYWERGEIERAIAIMEEDVALAESVNSLTPLIGTRADLGLLYGELGDVGRGLALANQARAVAEEQLPILRFWAHAAQVTLLLRRGDRLAAAQLSAALADYQTVKVRFGYMPFMWIHVGLVHGEMALAQGAFQQAVALMDDLYGDMCEAGIWYLRADVLHLKGRALLGLGNVEEAHEVLHEARAAAEKLGSRRALWPILVSLAEVAQQYGDAAVTASLWQEAKDIVEEIVTKIGPSDIQIAFLNLPWVRDLLSLD